MKQIKIKRIYEEYGNNDGYRVLVDRLWPRGIKKDKAKIDEWMKEIAPSDNLRKWFHHDPDKWASFERKYMKELDNNGDLIGKLNKISRTKTITLLYSAKDKMHNQALVLQEYLKNI